MLLHIRNGGLEGYGELQIVLEGLILNLELADFRVVPGELRAELLVRLLQELVPRGLVVEAPERRLKLLVQAVLLLHQRLDLGAPGGDLGHQALDLGALELAGGVHLLDFLSQLMALDFQSLPRQLRLIIRPLQIQHLLLFRLDLLY